MAPLFPFRPMSVRGRAGRWRRRESMSLRAADPNCDIVVRRAFHGQDTGFRDGQSPLVFATPLPAAGQERGLFLQPEVLVQARIWPAGLTELQKPLPEEAEVFPDGSFVPICAGSTRSGLSGNGSQRRAGVNWRSARR